MARSALLFLCFVGGCALSHEVGDGDALASSDSATPIDLSHRAVAIAVGTETACVVRANGTVACWGQAPLGGTDEGYSATPLDVPGISDAVAIAIGPPDPRPPAICAVRSSGAVVCWGPPGHAVVQSATGEPTEIAGVRGATAVSVAESSACALVTGGRVMCWGDALGGDLVRGTSLPSIPGVENVVQLASGYWFHCGRRADGTVTCWGEDYSGSLGDGGLTSHGRVEVPGIDDAVSLAAVSTGAGSSACVARASGGVTCWGDLSFFGVAYGAVGPTDMPEVTGEHFDVVATNGASLCAIDAGEPICFGSDLFASALGLGHADGTFPAGLIDPAPMRTGTANITAISMGWMSTCVLRATGEVLCTGANYSGELGDGTTTPHDVPVRVAL